MNVKEKLIDWRNRLRDRHMFSIVMVCIIVTVFAGLFAYRKQREYRQVMENQYNLAFFELVNYIQNVETYLAKTTITNTPEHSAEMLTNVWREANLAQAYLAQLPISNNELANTSKFLNQVSDYSYALSKKSIYNEKLTDEELKNLKELYNYSVSLENTFILMKKNGLLRCMMKLFTINSLSITDEQLCKEIEKWLIASIQRSTLISGASEKERYKFFFLQREKIRTLIENVKSDKNLDYVAHYTD